MNKYKKLTFDTFLFAISTFASKILIFFLLPLYTTILSTKEYGIVDLMSNIVNLIYPILTLAIAESCLRFLFYKKIKRNEIVSNTLLIIIFSFIFLSLIYIPLKILNLSIVKYWWYLVSLYIGYSLQNFLSFYCRGINKKKVFAIQGIIQTIFLLTLNLLFLLFLKMGLYGYILSLSLSYYIASFYMIIASKIYKEFIKFKINKKLLCDMLIYSIPIIPTTISWWINTSSDKYFIIGFLGIAESGIYSVAHKIPSLISIISSIFNNAWSISAISESDDDNKDIFYTKVFSIYFVLVIIVGMFLIIASPIISRVLFANEYYKGWIYIAPLVCAAVFQALSGFIASIFRAIKKTQILFISTLIGAIFNVILNYILIQILGIIGVAYATVISFLIVFIIRLNHCLNYINLKIDIKKIIISIVVMLMTMLIMCNNIKNMYIYSTILFVFIFLLNYKYIRYNSKKILRKIKEK